MEYTEAYRRLSFEVLTVSFIKRDGSIRNMLCTRNLSVSSLIHQDLSRMLSGHDNRCNIKNGNMAVIDLEIGESRSFSVGRVIYEDWHGEVETLEELRDIMVKHQERLDSGYFDNLSTSGLIERL